MADRLARSLPSLSDTGLDQEVPPVITCARCGQASCEGCAPERSKPVELDSEPAAQGVLPWEGQTASGYLRMLVLTALSTAHPEQACFRRRQPGSLLRALHFALAAETLAIVSFALPWTLGFCGLFPELTWRLLHSPRVVALGGLILGVLILGVVLLHMLWAAALEWAIARHGVPAAYALGQRFGFYACGWDLLSSPAGLLLVSALRGTAAARGALSAGIAVPRRALTAYLEEGRGIPVLQHRGLVRTCFGITAGAFFSCLLGLPALLWLYW